MSNLILMLALLGLPLIVVALMRRWAVWHRAAGAAGLALVFLMTGAGHFFLTDLLAQMIPPVFPQREFLVLATGVVELAIAVGLLLPATRRTAGLAAIAVLIGFLPFNVYAAIARVPIGGHEWGLSYLLIRVPMQAILIGWAWWFTVRRQNATTAGPT